MYFQPRYIPLPEDDEAIIRLCLFDFAKEEQRRGTIPPEVSEVELQQFVEMRVPYFLQTLQSNPALTDLREAGQLETWLRGLIHSVFQE